MNKQKSINVFILGFGRVGQALVKQLMAASSRFEENGLFFRITGLADSKALLYKQEGLTSTQIDIAINQKQQGVSLQRLVSSQSLENIPTLLNPRSILVDTSASQDTFSLHKYALSTGTGIVLANKIPLCQPWADVKDLFSYPYIRYEATVGAGLPVISTLNYLLQTGDELEEITGCLSGTLGYLCSQLETGVPYSRAIRDAHTLNYTEPDPRQDLGGMDVARKAVILSRMAGIPAELTQLSIEPLYPRSMDALSIKNFLESTGNEDGYYAKLVEKALADHKVPRYTAHVTQNDIRVGLSFVDKASPLGSLNGTDNYVALRTSRYSTSPLIVSGPGAGIEVTAAAVFGDIIQLGKEIL